MNFYTYDNDNFFNLIEYFFILIRFFDIFLSFVVILFLLPLFVLISLILICSGENQIFFVQPRIGKGKKIFGLLKFATMLKNSPNLPGGDITAGNDPRVLPFGKFLRKTKINELPQLWNILKGDISFVGPRPLTPNTFEFYSIDIQKNLTSICPGLTGVGSIVFRDEESLINFSLKKPEIFYKEDIAPYKGTLETWFSDNININVYFKIILLTVWVIIFPKSNLIYRVFPELPSKPNNLKLE